MAILIVAALLAVELARLTLATGYADTRPALAERLAPQLPAVLVSTAMAEVGQAAAQGQVPPQSALDRLRTLGRVAPLRPEPLLVQGAMAQKSGDLERAEQLLVEARERSPRSAAARFLLADLWLSQGRIPEGLGEMAALSRLLPQSTAQIAPALAQYARTPGAESELERLVVGNPQLEQPLLAALAADPGNLKLILELDAAVPTPPRREAPPWQGIVLNGLIARGDFGEAYALWRRLARYSGPRPLLFNPEFRDLPAPPPFNWDLRSSNGGLAESAGGRLRALHYGRDDAVLATQLLLLSPGRYRFQVNSSGTISPGALRWRLICLPSKKVAMQLELTQAGPSQAAVEVPGSGCGAQRLELQGLPQDMPKESDVLIGPIALQRGGQ